MPKGIFNPYKEKVEKKNFQAAVDFDNPYDTEFGTAPLGNIKLDGDSHVLELKEIELKDVPTRLGALIKDVIEQHREVLIRHSIDLLPPEGTRLLKSNEVSLPTPSGHICVSIIGNLNENQPKIEVEVFRRVACALREVPRSLLAKHKARLIVRA